ncbi:MAG TPA: hypothetical protein VFM37_14350 [Pseudonocardiaceae bacterium]|nr:hypothetical protein [Pseudonocardiaceae bacterium]
MAETGDQDERTRALAGLARARDPGAGQAGELGDVSAPRPWPAGSAAP